MCKNRDRSNLKVGLASFNEGGWFYFIRMPHKVINSVAPLFSVDGIFFPKLSFQSHFSTRLLRVISGRHRPFLSNTSKSNALHTILSLHLPRVRQYHHTVFTLASLSTVLSKSSTFNSGYSFYQLI